MKPWQTLNTVVNKTDAQAPRPPVAQDDRLLAINALMKASRRFWQGVGRAAPRVCQFDIRDGITWFIEVDEDGGRAVVGAHKEPTVRWSSDQQALEAAFQGRLLPGRVQFEGQVQQLAEVLRALGDSSLRAA